MEMLLPDKHILLSESLIGFGGFLLGALTTPKTVDSLWSEFENAQKTGAYPTHQSFDSLIATLCFLYAIGTLDIQVDGRLARCV
jgi:hypothetical protein